MFMALAMLMVSPIARAEEAGPIQESGFTAPDGNTWEEPSTEDTGWHSPGSQDGETGLAAAEETELAAAEETETEETGAGGTEGSAGEATEPLPETATETEPYPETATETESYPETGNSLDAALPGVQGAGAIGMFAAAVTLTGKYDGNGHGQEWDADGFCQHLDTAHTNEAGTPGSGSAPHTNLKYENIFLPGNDSLGYNAFLKSNASGRSSAAASCWSLVTPDAADNAFWYGRQFFQWDASQKAEAYDSALGKLYAIYPGAVGYYDRSTGLVEYYDLKLTLVKFRKSVGRKKVNGAYERDVKTAQFSWCPNYPGITAAGIDYADIKFEVLNPGTTTAASIVGFKGFTLIKDVDWWQGIAFKTSDNLAYGTYNATGKECICASSVGDYTYLHSTSNKNLNGEQDNRTHVGIEFRNGTVFRVVHAQGKFSQNGNNKLESTFGGKADIPDIPANVALTKYAGTDPDVTKGLDSNQALALPYYCYDTFYYRVTAKFNNAYFTGGTLTDEFPEWLAVNGVNVYKKVNNSWQRVQKQVTGTSTAFGQKKQVTVQLGNSAELRNQEYCIEYEVKLPTAAVFAGLSRKPVLQGSKYQWTNTAALAYNYTLGGVSAQGALSASADVTMPQGQAPAIKKYVGNRSVPSSKNLTKTLTNGCGDVFSYYLDVSGIQPNMLYEPLVVTDQLPSWLIFEGAVSYYKSGSSWVTSSCWNTSCNSSNKFTVAALNHADLAKGTEHMIEVKVRVVDALAFYKLAQKPGYNSSTKKYNWYNTASLTAAGSGLSSSSAAVSMPDPGGLYVLAHKYDADTGREIMNESRGGGSVFGVYEYSAEAGDFHHYSGFYVTSSGYKSELPLLRTSDNQGKFYVKEVNAPVNYALNTDWQFNINLSDYEGSNKPSDNVINIDGSDACRDKRSGGVIFRKLYKDPKTGEEIPVPGVTFRFQNTYDYVVHSSNTDNGGYAAPLDSELLAGATLKVYESCYRGGFPIVDQVPIGEIHVNSWREASWIPYNTSDMANAGITTAYEGAGDLTIVTVYNTPNTFTVQKREQGTGKPLRGAEMSILDANGNVVKNFTTDDNGSYTVAGLPFGAYVLHEDKAPDGYRKAADIAFAYTTDKQTVTMYDEPISTFDLTVKKRVRASDMWEAHGDQFFLFDVEGTDHYGEYHHYTKTWHNTGEVRLSNGYVEGTLVFRDIPMGDYTVSERLACDFYGYVSVTGCDWECTDWLDADMTDPGDPIKVEKVLIKPTTSRNSPVVTFSNYKDTWDDYRDTDFVQNVIPFKE